MTTRNTEISSKIVMVSAEETPVGKSRLRHALDGSDFDDRPTFGAEFSMAWIGNVKFQLWEIGSHQKFTSLRPSYIKGAQALLVFDLTNKSSLQKLSVMIEEIKKGAPDASIMLVGTKLDLTDQIRVSDREIADFCKQHNISQHFKVSSLPKERNEEVDALRNVLVNNAKEQAQNSQTHKKSTHARTTKSNSPCYNTHIFSQA